MDENGTTNTRPSAPVVAIAPATTGEPFVTAMSIRRQYRVANNTLRTWADAKRVRIVRFGAAGKRLYSLPDIRDLLQVPATETPAGLPVLRPRSKIVYCRVSSQKQKEDLVRQRALLVARYPQHEVVEDIASGVNFHRRGLVAILERAIHGDVEEVVVAYRDRLCRIAYELVETVLRACRCRLVVLDADLGPGPRDGEQSELQEDLMAIVTYFVASNNGKRAAQNRKRRARAAAAAAKGSEAEEGADDSEGTDEEGNGSSGSEAV